jgi:hypothetical protein
MIGWISRRSPILLLAVAVGAVGSIGGITAAMADIPDSGIINGCYKTSGAAKGALSIIDRSAGQTCPSGTSPLSWNQTGPQGPAGPSTAGPGGLDVTIIEGPTGDSGKATAMCPADHPYVLGGGSSQGSGSIAASLPVFGAAGEESNSGNGWSVTTSTFPSGPPTGAYAICAR